MWVKNVFGKMSWSLEKLNWIRKNLDNALLETQNNVLNLIDITEKIDWVELKIENLSIEKEEKEELTILINSIKWRVQKSLNSSQTVSYCIKWAHWIADTYIVQKEWMAWDVLKLEKENLQNRLNCITDLPTHLKNSNFLNELWDIVLEEWNNFSIIFIDIDDLKKLNDFKWHEYWDIILKFLSIYLYEYFDERNYWISVRKSWDEFVILSNSEKINEVLEKLLDNIEWWKILEKLKDIEILIIEALNNWNLWILDKILDERYKSLAKLIYQYICSKKEKNINEWFNIWWFINDISFSYWIIKAKEVENYEINVWNEKMCVNPESIQSLINAADKLMYFSKWLKKNKTTIM